MSNYHQDIRKMMAQRRNQMPEALRTEFSKTAAANLVNTPFFKNAHRIACYLKHGAEIDPQFIINQIADEHKCCYLPVIDPDQYGKMYFAPFTPGDQLSKSRFGILEPSFNPECFIEPENLDLIVLPLVAFDKNRNRIGTGGGYYDRAFEFTKNKPDNQRPFLCGFAYSFQEVEDAKPSVHDVPLDAVVTEKGLLVSSLSMA